MSKVYLTLGFGLISVGMALPAFAGVTLEILKVIRVL